VNTAKSKIEEPKADKGLDKDDSPDKKSELKDEAP